MNKLFVLGSAALLSMGVAAPASAQSASHILRGAGIGAAGGVVAGAVIPGLSVGEGALIGGAGGALYNTLINKGHRTYRSRSYYAPRYSSSRRATTSSAPAYRSYSRQR
ncbi:hypothetical protein [Rhizorhabdus dicambivorans]|uniref:Glycine zipper domain-containing protein n=1 Tax=Rhizorhabdus dicambivorans TaxID=1850238 RepID=A0A2A4FTB4_9SPHN|nr:hypothetical protein [Rhizorhabdus dicambivorans]ATE65629.1 hypothetical protein CMV14_15465 [Rhizorhabdus dicambivorans]PCE40970.1 hypothetical protein COO09_17375 [Rhizorhabdus dicambivorans]